MADQRLGRRAGATRRTILNSFGAAGAAIGLGSKVGLAATEPTKMRPQPGDVLVFAQGDRKYQDIRPEDLEVGGPQQMAWPKDPASQTVRDGSRLNQVVVVRLAPEELGETTKSHAADGVVAYSAVCTHQNCPVSMWKSSNSTLYCSCHGSEFDPKNNAEVVNGPAPRRLAALPLEVKDGLIVAAAELQGKVGLSKP